MSSFSTKSSVRDTTKPTNVFYVWYAELCRRLNTSPLSVVKPPKLRSNTVLDFVCDRIRPEEWKPLLSALEKDTSLHVIAIRSRMQCQFLHDIDNLDKLLRMKRRVGSLWTSYMLTALLKSLCRAIKESNVLNCVELEGLPITIEYMQPLLVSLSKNTTLKIVSLPYCSIRDEGCRELCLALRFQPNVEILNLSGCGLTSISGGYIADVIKFQRINRYCECWHKSLRYEDPNVDNMGGLKRITLNNNPNIGDEGLSRILDELDDDLWIKAIDMQKCGISENLAKRIIDLVEYSRSLEVVDFRGNERLSSKTIETILEIINRKQPPGYEAEYQWCFTATSLHFENSSARISNPETTNKISGIQKSRSVPFGRVTSSNNFSLRRTATTTNMKKRVTEKGDYSKKTIDQAKKDIMELNNKLQEEIVKREQTQQANEMLMRKLEAIKNAGFIEIKSANKNELVGKNSVNTFVSKKTNVSKQTKNGIVEAKRRKVVFSPAKEDAKSILENLLYKDGVEQDNLDVRGYFEESIKSTSKVALYLDTSDKKSYEEMSTSNISLIKFIQEMNGNEEDNFGLDSARADHARSKVKNGVWLSGTSRTVIKVR